MICFCQTPALLTPIWRDCFPDDLGFLPFYAKNIFKPGRVLVYTLDDTPVSMLTIIPSRLAVGSDAYNVGYLFAVGTLKSHRGQGIAGQLITHALEHMRGQSLAASITIPETPGLFEYYKRFGYSPAFGIEKNTVTNPKKVDYRNVTVDDIPLLDQLYNQKYGHLTRVLRSHEDWENLLKSFQNVFVSGSSYAFVRTHPQLTVAEYAGSLSSVYAAINHFGADCAIVHDHGATPLGSINIFNENLKLPNELGYMNLLYNI